MALQLIQAGGMFFHPGISSDSWGFHAQALFLAHQWLPWGRKDAL